MFFSMRIRIQLLFNEDPDPALQLCKKLHVEEFSGVEIDKKDRLKVKSIELFQIYCNFFK